MTDTDKGKQHRAFCGTYNNYSVSCPTDIVKVLDGFTGCEYIFQEEKGDSGTPHLQMYVRFSTPRDFKWQKKLSNKIHWAYAHKSKKINVAYCSKEQDFDSGLWTNMDLPVKIIDPLKGKDLYEWQASLKEKLLGPVKDREVVWVVDESGGHGKSAFIKHMCIAHDSIIVGGSAKDVGFCIASMDVKPVIVFWNLTRTQEGFVSYQGIEQVKDGCFFASKYESKMVVYNPPHVIIMANFEPDKSMLTDDRWTIIKLTDFVRGDAVAGL